MGRVLRPGVWNAHGVAVPDNVSELDNETPMPPPIVRAPSMPPRHRPRPQQSHPARLPIRLVLLVVVVASLSAALIVHATTATTSQECRR